MTSLDFLYYSLGTGFLIITIFISYMAYEAAKTLKSLRDTFDHLDNIAINIEDVTTDLSELKNSLKIGSLKFLSNILKFAFGRK